MKSLWANKSITETNFDLFKEHCVTKLFTAPSRFSAVRQEHSTIRTHQTRPCPVWTGSGEDARALVTPPPVTRQNTEARIRASSSLAYWNTRASTEAVLCLIGWRCEPADDDTVVIGQHSEQALDSHWLRFFFFYKREDESCKRSACLNNIAGLKIKRAASHNRFSTAAWHKPGSCSSLPLFSPMIRLLSITAAVLHHFVEVFYHPTQRVSVE